MVSLLLYQDTSITHPITLPNPSRSFSDGKRLLNIGELKTLTNHGTTVVTMTMGNVSSVVLMYSYTSESVSKKPNGSPKAKSESTSRVKNCARRPRSIGLFSSAYLRRSLMNARIFLSILGSRFSTSRPPYYNPSVRARGYSLGKRTPADILDRSLKCSSSSLHERMLLLAGSKRIPSYQGERRYSVRTLRMCFMRSGSSVRRSLGLMRAIEPAAHC